MNKKVFFCLTLLTLLLLTGCNFPTGDDSTPTVDEAAVRTSVAGTLAAQSGEPEPLLPTETVGEGPQPPTDTLAPPPTASDTPSWTASLTPSETLTPSITPSLTSSVPMVSVSVDTNCRKGPGVSYDKVGVLLVGETAVVVGRDATGNYWLIENPDASGTCWLWGEYASATGNTGSLPVVTPPPSPTATPTATAALAFNINYDNFHDCGGTIHLTFYVSNKGSLPLESVDVAVVELATYASVTETYTDVPFVATANGCPPGLHVLAPGEVGYIAAPVFVPLNSGAHAAAIRICTQDGLVGMCISKEFNFTIP